MFMKNKGVRSIPGRGFWIQDPGEIRAGGRCHSGSCLLASDSCPNEMKVHPAMLMKSKEGEKLASVRSRASIAGQYSRDRRSRRAPFLSPVS